MIEVKVKTPPRKVKSSIPHYQPTMSAIPCLRLIYFPVRARAEAARMIVAYGGIACKDEDCNSFFGMSFPEAKKAGKLPLGQLPVLEVAVPGNKLKMIGELSITRADRKSQVKQCLGFLTADFLSLFAYESAEQNPIA